jgi:hypothetical protein
MANSVDITKQKVRLSNLGRANHIGFGGAFFKNRLGKRTRQDAAREFKQRFVIGNQEKSSIVVV